MHKLLNDLINSPTMFSQIEFKIPFDLTRNHKSLSTFHATLLTHFYKVMSTVTFTKSMQHIFTNSAKLIFSMLVYPSLSIQPM